MQHEPFRQLQYTRHTNYANARSPRGSYSITVTTFSMNQGTVCAVHQSTHHTIIYA